MAREARRARSTATPARARSSNAGWTSAVGAGCAHRRCSPALLCTLGGRPLQHRCVRAMLSRYATRAGIDKRVHPHGLRHTHAGELAAGEQVWLKRLSTRNLDRRPAGGHRPTNHAPQRAGYPQPNNAYVTRARVHPKMVPGHPEQGGGTGTCRTPPTTVEW
ncbi:MAG: tyrosine-type recombinase/integrase [Egibacteraceae bacterium]